MANLTDLVFVPTPGMGHLLSTVELAKLILQRNQHISISIHMINMPNSSAQIKAFVDAQSRDNPYPTRLIFVTLPPLSDLPNPSSPFVFATIIELHKPLVKQAVEDRINAGFGKPVGFVLDMFCTGFVDIANELNVPSYIYFTSGAYFLNFLFYAQSLADDHGIDIAAKFSDPDSSLVVPGFKNPITSKVIPGVLQDKEHGCKLLINFVRKFKETKGILVNTYVELELFAIQALLNNDDKNIPSIYPVGPILGLNSQSRGGSDNSERELVIQWLDGQPKCSVVFLCFGSMGSFEEKQVQEIANGLDKSEYRFLWTLRKPPTEGKPGPPSDNKPFLEALPEGFINRTSNRGKVIGWAPQVEVLAHPAIGGFVSHCGWNSTLESLWFGIPMATWPMYAEQQLNAFELVKELELAVEIRMDYKRSVVGRGNFLVTAEEVEKAVKKLMNIDEKMRENIKKMCDKGKKAIKEGGSSYNSIGQFIDDLLRAELKQLLKV